MSAFLDGEVLGSYLAGYFGLNKEYFRIAYKQGTQLNAQIREVNGFIFVKVISEVRKLIEQGFISYKIEDGDSQKYDYKYKLSKNCTIGFWK
ncbi:MAG: hypothetical protein GXP61_08120 [Epsilonproteobacteria bacterium]|nr:hypothetical protein [Campylobacterota bacterium]